MKSFGRKKGFIGSFPPAAPPINIGGAANYQMQQFPALCASHLDMEQNMSIFNLNSWLMQKLGLLYDLIILNLLTILCSLPVVTMGAAVSALYDAVWRLRTHEGTLLRNFFRAFRSNFKQATVMFLPLFLVGIALGNKVLTLAVNDAAILTKDYFPLVASCVLWGIISVWVFPLQTRFENKITRTYLNALYCALKYLPETVAVIVLNLLPWIVLALAPVQFMKSAILWLVLWFALAAYLTMWILKKPIEQLSALAVSPEDNRDRESSDAEGV